MQKYVRPRFVTNRWYLVGIFFHELFKISQVECALSQLPHDKLRRRLSHLCQDIGDGVEDNPNLCLYI